MPTPPFPILSWAIQLTIGAILVAMLIRAIASWFRIDERYAFIRLCARLTDPFLEPVRRIIRPSGFIDLSWFIVWFLLRTLQYLLIPALPPGW